MLEWKEEYSIGVETIDQQHRQLFKIGNKIYDLLENYMLDDKYDKIASIILQLKEYTIYHFKCEEEYMLEIKYPRYFSQKVEHDDFIDKIESIELDKMDENQNQFIRELMIFIFDWVLNHILQSDKQLQAK